MKNILNYSWKFITKNTDGFKTILFIFFFIAHASTASAGPIETVFADSIFNVNWLSTVDEVKRKYPKGEQINEYGIVSYVITDDRTVLEIKREPSNYIKFVFNSENQLFGVAIQFPASGTKSFTQLLTKLITHFGSQEDKPKNYDKTIVVQWPEDNGYKIVLTSTVKVFGEDDLIFSIGYTEPVKTDKGKMGF
jgi:hypothetical protein